MKIDLTSEEVELIVRALEEHAMRRKANGLSDDQAAALIQKLRPEQAGTSGAQSKP